VAKFSLKNKNIDIMEKNNKEKKYEWKTIFDAVKHNKGKGIKAKDLVDILR